jgi:nucleoside-diphosphate kinase
VSVRERTFVLVKPDGVQRALVGEILGRFERRGLKIVGLKLMRVAKDLAETYYAEHKGKPFFAPLVAYVTAAPVAAMVLEGDNAVAVVRKMMGKTNAAEAEPGTIRGDFGLQIGRNLIHGSDSVASAEREIGLFFKPGDLSEYPRIDDAWLYE